MVEVSARDRPKADGLAMRGPEANPRENAKGEHNVKCEYKDEPAKATEKT